MKFVNNAKINLKNFKTTKLSTTITKITSLNMNKDSKVDLMWEKLELLVVVGERWSKEVVIVL
jgi:hypothetical protein